jgi:hypothetical protein
MILYNVKLPDSLGHEEVAPAASYNSLLKYAQCESFDGNLSRFDNKLLYWRQETKLWLSWKLDDDEWRRTATEKSYDSSKKSSKRSQKQGLLGSICFRILGYMDSSRSQVWKIWTKRARIPYLERPALDASV